MRLLRVEQSNNLPDSHDRIIRIQQVCAGSDRFGAFFFLAFILAIKPTNSHGIWQFKPIPDPA